MLLCVGVLEQKLALHNQPAVGGGGGQAGRQAAVRVQGSVVDPAQFSWIRIQLEFYRISDSSIFFLLNFLLSKLI